MLPQREQPTRTESYPIVFDGSHAAQLNQRSSVSIEERLSFLSPIELNVHRDVFNVYMAS